MKSEPLDFQHQNELVACFKALNSCFSEYSFANLYLFRKVHEYEVVRTNTRLFIRGVTYDKKRFLMPLFDMRTAEMHELKGYLEGVDFFYPITEECVAEMKFNAYFLEADSDYIYSVEKIRTYPGRHLQGRRNLVHQFQSNYQAVSYPITKENSSGLHTILDHWGEHDDFHECLEAIESFERLNLFGRLFIVDGVPSGFILAEMQNLRTTVLHFAKADSAIKGIYQYMYQDFALHLQAEVQWLNWEQDLGDSGLKQSKASYSPEKLLKKMRIIY